MIDISNYIDKYKFIPIITGPTASGKSSLALELCRALGGELISADSMQIYRGLDIGTAKDTADERNEIYHHMTDIVDPGQSYSVSDYVSDCAKTIDEVLKKGKLPVICGGTGQYISALCYGLNYGDNSAAEVRTVELEAEFQKDGIDGIYARLVDCDPAAAAKIHPNNTRRVIRALAVFEATGKTFTEKNDESMLSGPMYPFKAFMINYDRALLYERINMRVDIMINEGLEKEAAALYGNTSIDRKSTCFQAIGYKEFVDYFDGKVSIDDAIYQIKLRSRHYAKRQLTWFRGMGETIIQLEPIESERNVKIVLDSII